MPPWYRGGRGGGSLTPCEIWDYLVKDKKMEKEKEKGGGDNSYHESE